MILLLRYIIIVLFILPKVGFTQENYLYFLNSGEEAAQARIKIVNNAKKEILISYFIFEDDPIGLVGLELLLMHKQKNPDLQIKLLLDASANGVDKSILYYLEENGIEIREFHPLPKLFVPFNKINVKNFLDGFRDFNFRMHDKIIIVDSKELITGGRNIEKSYYGMDVKNFHDRDMYFNSENLALKVRDYFYQLWNSKHVKKMTYNKYYVKGENYDQMVNKMKNIKKYILFNENNFKEKTKDLDPKIKGIKFKKVIFLNSYNSKTGEFDPYFLSTSLFNFFINTKKLMLIETPYLLPTERFYKLLNHLSRKGVKIQFLTNSFCSTDVMPVVAAYDNEKPALDNLGIELYEYKGPDYLHAKSAVFDDSLALIGSYNMDPRSAYINTELVFIIEDKNIAKKLKTIIYNDMKNSVKVQKNKENTMEGYYDCDKSRSDMLLYLMFKFLTRFNWLYNLF